MRVLMTSTGYPGHVLPLLPFARAFVAAGHEVCLAGPRSRLAIGRQAGLEVCGWPEPPEEEVGRIVASAAGLSAEEGHACIVTDGFGRLATRASLPGALQIVGAWRPDAVVRESHEFAGYLAAERHGVPHARVALGLASTENEALALVAAGLDDERAALGLPPDPRAERVHKSPGFTFVPDALEHPGATRPAATQRFRAIATGAGSLPDWWPGNDDRLVYVTFGSVAGSLGFFPGLYRAVIDVLADLPARVLVTVGEDADPAALGPLPPNVHVERWVPQEVLMPHPAVVVCHGGYGSVLGGLAHGVPLVLLPLFAGDQWHNARRVAQIGAGICLEGAARTMFDHPGRDVLDELPSALGRVLDGSRYRRAAQRVEHEIEALPPVGDVARALRAITDAAARPAARAAARTRRATP
jgi:UDP:flavonoid glycosyltransferase YjiC (YdhE family)